MLIIKPFLKYIKKYIPVILMIFVLSLLSSGTALSKTIFMSVIIDNVLILRNIDLLKNIVVVLVMLLIFEIFLSYILGYLNTYVSQMVTIALRLEFMKKIFKVNLKTINEGKSSDLISRITSDVSIISNFICYAPINFISSILTAFVTIFILFSLSWKMGLLSTVLIIIQIAITMRISKIARKNYQELRKMDSLHIGLIQQIFLGIKYIKSYRLENYNKKKYFKFSKQLLNLNFKSFYINLLYSNTGAILTFLGSILVFVVGVISVYNAEITIGVLFVFDSITDILYKSINNIVTMFLELNKTYASFYRINEIDSMEAEDEGAKIIDNAIERIEYKDAIFKYDDNYIFTNFNFCFMKGNTYALIGKSGEGKSTLISLLLKFYHLNDGVILVNHVNLDEIKTSFIRERISVVFQDGYLIDGTIRENIIFGAKNVKEEDIKDIISICELDEFVSELPNGFDTLIEEDGTNFSGGQKQRILIARALIRSCDVYIFDEAFSQIDKKNEAKIMTAINRKFINKIIIYITHNISSIKSVQNILVIENKERVLTGDHKNLLSLSTVYKSLYDEIERQL